MVAAQLLAWYDRHRRRLPWRPEPGMRADPYAVWLSEIMLQQTTVAAVQKYFRAFIARWPSVAALAEAPVEEVMKEWAGLGYYARARNLHACAKAVARAHGGQFPRTEQALLALPGIGPYTAAAIAAIAYDRRAVVIDGNVERVVARLAAIETPLPGGKPAIRAAADAITPNLRAGDFAQAMMDLGATICTHQRPACALCPLREFCRAFARGQQERLPVKAGKPERPLRAGNIFVFRTGDKVLVRTRAPRGLLGGMTEFPGSDWLPTDARQSEEIAFPIAARWKRLPGRVEQIFTHFALHLTVYTAELPEAAAPPGMRSIDIAALGREGLPSVMLKVAAHAGLLQAPPQTKRNAVKRPAASA
ncbi:MAG: A/G-specific adenine glycosylase [Methylobacteriaceae bacterium]|jgi:A/G-specific adenine glycosylase|nr:A/G-specific adenine glycosylase [Methylobacteriaceae bacterium]